LAAISSLICPWRTSAGEFAPCGGVGEQQLDVLGAHLAPVQPVDGARAAIDPPRHLQHGMVGEGLGGGPVAVVDQQRHLGVVAPGAPPAAGEDDLVHAVGAHGLGRGRAHDPAQRLQEIGLAAAVGAHNARQPGLDPELGRFDEGLEARKAQALELHGPERRLSRCGVAAGAAG
jgi:hypothetical protein